MTACGGNGRASGTIVFESDHSGHDALYAVRPDGSGLAQVLDLRQEASVFWTRDGTKALLFDYHPRSVVFEAATGSRRDIRLAGFAPESETGWAALHWSPDGKHLAYPTGAGNIVVVDTQSGARRRVAGGGSDGAVAWSPDGKRLLFINWPDESVSTAPVSGGRRTRLARLPAGDSPDAVPAWSGDGKWISLLNSDPGSLHVARADGTGLHAIAGDAQDAAWSPSGARIAFAGHRGIVVVDLEHGHRRQLTRDRTDGTVAWSPDGQRIVFSRDDLAHRSVGEHEMQLWTMKADGSDEHPVTRAFSDGGSNGPAVWVRRSVRGTRAPRLPLVALSGTRTLATALPIVALAAVGERAAVAQGLGGPTDSRVPFGPIVVWNPLRKTATQIPTPGCGTAYDVELTDVFFTGGGVGYGCHDYGIAYYEAETLKLVQPGRRGTTVIAHADGGEFSGSSLGGVAGDGNAISFDDGVFGSPPRGRDRVGPTRIWKATGDRKAIVATFRGRATVISLDAGRIALLRGRHAVSVLSPDGRMRTFTLRGGGVIDAVLRGSRLIVLQSTQLAILDITTGRTTASWPVRRGFGPTPELEDAEGDLAAYVVGAAVHVLRLTDGREIVIDVPNATEPVLARYVPSGLFYSFNASYRTRPGRLAFVTREQLDRALASRAAAR